MPLLNWIAEHWVLVIFLALIMSATYSVPKMVCALLTAMAMDRIR